MGKTGRVQTTIIERMGYDKRVEELYKEGKSIPEIHRQLVSEGKEISIHTLRHYIDIRYNRKKREQKKKAEEQRTTLSVENPELKLMDAIKEAMKNYESCKKDGKLIAGREKEALEWHKLYNDLLEKWMKASGVYERAKADATKEDDKRIEVYWVFQTRCDNCNALLEEKVVINSATSISDQQTERIKEEIIEELEDAVTSGKDETVLLQTEPKTD
jgi:hypothetical protein